MKRIAIVFACLFFLSSDSFGQLMVSKRVGSGASGSKTGYGAFGFYDFPLSGFDNRSIRLEIFDFAIFPGDDVIGYVSIKAGYKHGFGESLTGFYVEPQVGWCRVINPSDYTDKVHADGIALALEGGYTLEVGDRGNTFNFGLKFESDLAGTDYTTHSIGLRVSYSFHLFRRSF